jgi:hypothetical protein
MINEYGAIRGIEIGRKTIVLRGNMPQYYFVHHKSQMTCPSIEPRRKNWEASD